MAEVRLQEGESLENALRRFKRKVMTEDIIKDVKRHSYYLKPGERRRVKQALAQKRARKKIRKDGDQVAPKRVATGRGRPTVSMGLSSARAQPASGFHLDPRHTVVGPASDR